jgi:hypothetical protein
LKGVLALGLLALATGGIKTLGTLGATGGIKTLGTLGATGGIKIMGTLETSRVVF